MSSARGIKREQNRTRCGDLRRLPAQSQQQLVLTGPN